MKTFQLDAKLTCPTCAKRLDGAAAVSGVRAPKDGDLSICGYCATLLQFTPENFRALTPDDLARLPDDERATLEAARQVARDVRRMRDH